MANERKKDILKQLNSKLPTRSNAHLGITGSKLKLLPPHSSDSQGSNIHKPWQQRSPDSKSDIVPSTGNPWQHMLSSSRSDIPGASGGKKLLVTMNASRENSMSARSRPRQDSGKGWTVSVSAVREVEDIRPAAPLASSSDRSLPKQARLDHPVGKKDSSGDIALPRQGKKNFQLVSRKKPKSKLQSKREVERKRERSVRIRYLERKYFMKWSGRVFGRVLPSVARQHHAIHCQGKVFRTWQDLWWVEHREWKLGIRAECHNRYRLWIMVWKAWTTYTHSRKVKKKKNLVSLQFLYRVRLRRAWLSWKVYVQHRRDKKLKYSHSAQWHLDVLKKRCWLQWKRAMDLRLQHQAMDEVALHHWATCLQRKVWFQWRTCYNNKLVWMRKMVLACEHSAKKLKLVAMKAWLEYTELRRHKLYQRGVAVGYHTSALVLKTFSCWKTRFHRSRQMSQFQDMVAQKNRLAICRRAIVKWKFYIAQCQYKTELGELAELHYSFTLKCKSVCSFKHHLVQQRRQSQDKEVAREFEVRTRLKQCWLKWLQRCEHNEEIALGMLTRKARGHVGGKRTRKALTAWIKYVLQCRHRHQLRRLAEDHFRQSALPKCFQAFRENVAIGRYKRALTERSEEFRRETLLSMAFYKWWRESQLSQDVRMLERVAILHWEESAKRNLLGVWRNRSKERLLCHEQEEVAVQHCRQAVLKTVFTKWRSHWTSRTSLTAQLQTASHHHVFTSCRRVWQAWRKYVCQERERHTCCKLANNHYHATLLGKVMNSWKEYHGHASLKAAKVRAAMGLHRVWLQRHALSRWREEVGERRCGRELHRVASSHHSHSNLLKHLRQWKEIAMASKQQREREDETVEDAMTHLMRLRVARMLQAWRVFTEEEFSDRTKMTRADCHYHRLLQHRVFMAWKDRHVIMLRKRLLKAQCVRFESRRLLSSCYIKWRHQFMCELQYKQKGVVSLWHWSHMLEQKVLKAWLLYVAERRRKAERYSQAMSRHRAGLLELGVRQWIRVATQRKAQREEAALTIQTKNTQNVLRCVRRCAHHWRELARKHRPPPPLAPPPAPLTLLSSVGTSNSAEVWTTLARQLKLPETVGMSRPQPRRPDVLISCASYSLSCTALSDSLPRLLPPPPPQNHTTGCPGEVGGSSLDLTAEPLMADVSNSSSPPMGRTSDHISLPDDTCTPLPLSHLGPLRDKATCHTPLPSSHPLRDRAVQDEIRAMRQRMQKFFQLKVHQKALQGELAGCRTREEQREKVQRELDEVDSLIHHSEPVLRDVAAKINKLLQLCS